MIVSEVYNMPNSISVLHIYSDKGFFLLKNNELFVDAYVNNENEINDYNESIIPLPLALASNDFICENLITNNQLTEKEVLAAQPIIEKALNNLSDEDSYYVKFLYKPLIIDKEYQIGDRFIYQNDLYNTIQSAFGREMLGDNASTYFTKTEYPDYLIEDWKSTKEYQQNDKVKYGDLIYKSLIDNNSWSPTDFPSGWELQEVK